MCCHSMVRLGVGIPTNAQHVLDVAVENAELR